MPFTTRPCLHPGCPELVRSERRCPRHAREYQIQISQMRDPAVQRLYDRKWQMRRKKQLELQPWCEDCTAMGLYIPAIEVHHEQRHQGDKAIFLKSKLRSLCKPCHSRRTARR